MAHSCFTQSIDDFFKGKNPKLRTLYDAYAQLIENICGPVIVNVNKTRISFQARTRFAAVPGMTKDTLICHVWLKTKIESPRFSKVELFPPNNYVCQFRIKEAGELDDEVASWIAEAYRVGMQEV
jgi:hypothetical protein